MALTDHQNGLRFDIYERVHLSEGVAGIKDLVEVELVPHIQVLPQGDQALLRGNLLLSGTYVDEHDTADRTLEYLIPVEITLPMNRVQRVEDIAVEIENFDIDLLSARSLNITGVLSLNGLETVPAASPETWAETDEVVFVHEVKPQPPVYSETPREEQSEDHGTIELTQQERPTPAHAVEPESHVPEHHTKRQTASDYTEDNSYTVVIDAQQQEETQVNVSVESVSAQLAEGEADDTAAVASAVPEEKKDVKIAFSGKKSEVEPQSQEAANGLASLLHNHYSNKLEIRNGEVHAPSAAEAVAAGDKLEWKNLLLNSPNEQQEFRRLRLCIVQKEETLESIAKRYNLNPREIALYNRLGESSVTEGQIIYIPK
jgi:stage VI sporulation protein D